MSLQWRVWRRPHQPAHRKPIWHERRCVGAPLVWSHDPKSAGESTCNNRPVCSVLKERMLPLTCYMYFLQMLQMSASLGWSRFALMMDLMTSPLQSDQFDDDVMNRQVRFFCRILNLNPVCEMNNSQSGFFALAETLAVPTASPELGSWRTLLHQRVIYANEARLQLCSFCLCMKTNSSVIAFADFCQLWSGFRATFRCRSCLATCSTSFFIRPLIRSAFNSVECAPVSVCSSVIHVIWNWMFLSVNMSAGSLTTCKTAFFRALETVLDEVKRSCRVFLDWIERQWLFVAVGVAECGGWTHSKTASGSVATAHRRSWPEVAVHALEGSDAAGATRRSKSAAGDDEAAQLEPHHVRMTSRATGERTDDIHAFAPRTAQIRRDLALRDKPVNQGWL